MQRVALIGAGRTGQYVLKALPDSVQVDVYTSSTLLDAEVLSQAEIAIVFVPGSAVLSLLPTLLEAGIPIVIGSTGFTWPPGWQQALQQAKGHWVYASNFSIGMQLARRCMEQWQQFERLLPGAAAHIHEVHHVHKQDQPSGTAITWQQWLQDPHCSISSERQGEITGTHTLTLTTEGEELTLQHEARDGDIFARGAVWAAEYLLAHQSQLLPGLHSFSEFVDCAFKEQA